MTNATLMGKPDAGNPHVRFDEGEVASAKPRRGSLLYRLVTVCATLGFACAAFAREPIEIRVRPTAGGPRIFLDGKPIRPRFYYGSVPCLCPISWPHREEFQIPFRAAADTVDGEVRIDAIDSRDTMWFSKARLLDETTGESVQVSGADEACTLKFRKDGLRFVKGHAYRLFVTHRAARVRTYFTHEISYVDAAGVRKILPLPYGTTLEDTARLAAAAEVNLVTFSTDTSWGCENWWAPPDEPRAYDRIDAQCASLIAANSDVLLIPRVKADAPNWMLAQHPDMKMKFDKGFTIEMSSVSCRAYRRAMCAELETLTRHLRAKFPRNFAGLHVSGQNSAEWFYMLSQSENLSGYDVHTRDAFRDWLRIRGAADWATTEVPTPAERHLPFKTARLMDFTRFRQEEMATLLNDIGAAIRRGSDGKVLALFFYGYSWELGAAHAGAGETGHFAVEWLAQFGRDNVDGFSSPVSYTNREWPGSMPVMSAAETIQRKGFLWINEDDNRTHHEDIWDHMNWKPQHDPWVSRNLFMRNSAVQILRGYGDWWMDLFGRGWFRDAEIWKVRRELNALDDAMMARTKPYSPEIAVVVNEESFLHDGWGLSKRRYPLLNRRGFDACGATTGQYLLNDVLANPPEAKVFYLVVANNLTEDQQRSLARFKAEHPDRLVIEDVTGGDLTAEAIAARAREAGVHLFAAPNRANVSAAEGYVMVQALSEGPMEIDFGASVDVKDFLSGRTLGRGPRLTVPFRKGETRLFVAK